MTNVGKNNILVVDDEKLNLEILNKILGPEYNLYMTKSGNSAVKTAKKYFSTIGLEIYPLEVSEYAYLNECGADFVSVYQETYDTELYLNHHIDGPKRDFEYRFNAQERAMRGGIRGVSFGSLLGLGDCRKDVYASGIHAYLLQQKYPHAEIAFSVPRIRSYINSENFTAAGKQNPHSYLIGEKQLLQIILAYRVFMPFAGINISTRERAGFRDNVIALAANKISAGVKVGVGGHDKEQKGGEQFNISDCRSVKEIHEAILSKGLQPVYTDYIGCRE
jgi:2-iminoacetate synthase